MNISAWEIGSPGGACLRRTNVSPIVHLEPCFDFAAAIVPENGVFAKLPAGNLTAAILMTTPLVFGAGYLFGGAPFGIANLTQRPGIKFGNFVNDDPAIRAGAVKRRTAANARHFAESAFGRKTVSRFEIDARVFATQKLRVLDSHGTQTPSAQTRAITSPGSLREKRTGCLSLSPGGSRIKIRSNA
jgi:hypothetical protein